MPWQPFVYGGLAAVSAEVVSFPMDTSKIRLQVQGQIADSAMTDLRYRGMFHTLCSIRADEGVRSLYNGVRFAALRQATYGTIRFGIFFNVQQWWHNRGGKDDLHFLVPLGASSGFIASFITTPIDVMKVRSQATEQMKKRTVLKSMSKTYSTAGLAGLYQGKWPNAKRAAVVNGVEIPTYVMTKNKLLSWGWSDNTWTHFAAGGVTSITGAVCSQPFDVAKTRIMQQKPSRADIRVYTGFFDAVMLTVRHEGLFALWKGLVPTICRNAPWNVVFYITLEQFRLLDNMMYDRKEAIF